MEQSTYRRGAMASAAALSVAASVLVVQSAAPAVQGAPPAPERTIYYVSDTGSDANAGTSPDAPWASLGKVGSARLEPGDRVRLGRGSTFTDRLLIRASGLQGRRIRIESYGTGALPTLTGDCLRVEGSWVTVKQLRVADCDWAGISVAGDHVKVRRSIVTGSVAGVHVGESAGHTVVSRNEIFDNDKMSVNTPGGDDDSGAWGVLVNGDHATVSWNRIHGHEAPSFDYGIDGAAVEIYGATGTRVHHNVARDNHAFSELGDPTTSDTLFDYNLVTSTQPGAHFLVTRGAESGWGPVLGTVVRHNTVHNTGADSEGFICHDGCSPAVLTLHANIISAVHKVGYADGAYAGGDNFFSGGQLQFETLPSDQVDQLRDADLGLTRTRASTSPVVDRLGTNARGRDVFGQRLPRDGDGDGVARLDIGAVES